MSGYGYAPRLSGMSEFDAASLEQRRLRIGISHRALAERAGGLDRTHLTQILEGTTKRPRTTTLAKIDRALSDLEAEMGLDVDEPAPAPADIVTFVVRGNYGVDVTVSGPRDALPDLKNAVADLIAQLGPPQT